MRSPLLLAADLFSSPVQGERPDLMRPLALKEAFLLEYNRAPTSRVPHWGQTLARSQVMFPPDPYGQFDEQPTPDATQRPDSQPTTVPRTPSQSHPYHEPRAGGAPLPLPYDDYDPTYKDTPPHQPPVYQEQQPSTYPEAEPTPRGLRRIFRARQPRASRGQVYAPPPNYQPPIVYQPQPPPQQQIIYVRERRPSFFSISCSILAILLLMACGLTGVVIYRGVTNALQTVPANVTCRRILSR